MLLSSSRDAGQSLLPVSVLGNPADPHCTAGRQATHVDGKGMDTSREAKALAINFGFKWGEANQNSMTLSLSLSFSV